MTSPRWFVLCVGAFVPLACHGGAADVGDADAHTSIASDGAANSDGSDAQQAHSAGPVDRVGHPLVTTLLVPGQLQDDYNARSAFDPLSRILQDALESRLVQWDTLSLADGGPDPVDWPVPDGGAHPLLPLFSTDVLLVDTSLPCLAADAGIIATYLDIDKETNSLGPPHTTCGGRTLNENVVDATLNLLITGDRDGGPRFTQGLVGPAKPAPAHFPYLAEPN